MPLTPPNRRITAQDIAALAGVSRSAVSRAFTDGAYIDPDKRARILQAAEELGYRPNALAAGLQGGRSNLVAIFVGEIANEYDNEVTAALVAGLNRIGKWPIVISGSGAAARDAVHKVLSYPLDAMILRSGSLDEAIVSQCSKLNIPVISSGRVLDLPRVDNVCCRNQLGTELATTLLLERGRRQFGFIAGPAHYASSEGRRAGVVAALATVGQSLVFEAMGNFSVQSGFDAALLIPAEAKLDALICANDAMAIGALSALQQLGRRVAQDISVIGFDNIAMAAWPAFGLTTVRNPIDELVAAVLRLLDARITAPERPAETIYLTPSLVLRQSH
jgi:DNA-binding LacI/PurR family transcriptional regulator